MRSRIFTVCSVVLIAIGMSVVSFLYGQSRRMAFHEPHMSAAYGHLEQAKAELDRAAPNKGGHREQAIQLVNQAMQQVEEGERYYQEHGGR